VNAVDGEVVASTGPGVVVGDLPARDLDGDGLYDDVDGDGVSDLDDVFALAFDVLPLALQRPELVPFFDFDADGDVDLDDVFELAFS
jgi:PKD repeat protein